MLRNPVVILNRKMDPNKIILINASEYFGFEIVNESNHPLYIEPEFYVNEPTRICKLVFR